MVNNDYGKFRSFSRFYFGIELAHICMEEPTDFVFESPMARWQHSVTGFVINRLEPGTF